ncbi:MAG: 4-phosphoerythronate dehydrogenase [Bacteroidales bacterium]|nr:4-phosphoerythronate dehydrogenase [Bacteroidales bacterium]MDD3100297.1 4-phosphoerythronate dehydrogenase [Bacteroidales bacterium]MDD3639109.1 4-phosphoerythronate dehydrogenase [Bacteroidales bacterium]MDD3943668.1 4-phosphoerythronate dehydrogenase [Bacteroidales bacterium]MDD4480443.1 4-phosphoerythronate dehydrogenase [Bacteroidales bacterium]
MDTRPHIIADSQIPFLDAITASHARITRMPGHMIGPSDVRRADALVIRTRTVCNASLLQGSAVSFIGSATIGTDHIDLEYCASGNITVTAAPGCNAGAVMQYLFTALAAWARAGETDLREMTLGIVGVGNVGKKVEDLARHLGMKTILNDPPRALTEGPEGFSTLDRLLTEADIVTMHVPLTPLTRGMAGREFFRSLRNGACFVNTSRGAVVDESALREASGRLGGIILDVWQGEPHIDPSTVKITDLATPHIAGYSLEGKRNASQTVLRALARHFGWEDLKDHTIDLPPVPVVPAHLLFTRCFPIFVEDKRLRDAPHDFETQRNAYVYRREWTPEQYRQLTLCLPHKTWNTSGAKD